MAVSKDHYYKLGSEVPAERIEGASLLISELVAADDTAEWDYALDRLLKGLSTTRQSAKYGFSTALAEVMAVLVEKADFDLTTSSVLDKIVAASKVSASMKGKEVRALYFGRLFGFQAVVNSGILLKETLTLPEDLKKFCSLVVALLGTKLWLRESAMYTLCQWVAGFTKNDNVDESLLVLLFQNVADEQLTFTTEGVALYLTIPPPLRTKIVSQLEGPNQWKNGNPLARENLAVLARVLKDAEHVKADEDCGDDSNTPAKGGKNKNSKQKSTWSPKLPFVWTLLAEHFSVQKDSNDDNETVHDKKRKKHSSGASKKIKSDGSALLFQEFWESVVDKVLFSEKASNERKFWGFEVLLLFLPTVSELSLSYLFSQNAISVLTALIKQDKMLSKAASRVLDKVTTLANEDISKAPVLFRAVINVHSPTLNTAFFQRLKLADQLISIVTNKENVTDSQAKAHTQKILAALFAKFEISLSAQGPVSDDRNLNDVTLRWVLDKILLLVRSTRRFHTTKSLAYDEICEFMVLNTFFIPKEGAGVSSWVRLAFQERLGSILSELMSNTRKGHSWARYCVRQIAELEKNPNLEYVLELSDELAAIKDLTVGMLDTIKTAITKNIKVQQQLAFELLFSMVLIQLYMGESEAAGVLEELTAVYEDTFSTNDDTEAPVVLTEIILSFVSKKSTLLRKLGVIVWESILCVPGEDGELMVTEQCFQRLFAILESKENEDGQKALFEADQDMDAAEDDDEDEDEDEDGDSQSEAVSDLESESEANETVDKDTSVKLASALGIAHDGEVKYSEIDSFDDDEEDNYESESMDDEQMMAIDDELARIFKERRDAITANNLNKKKNDATAAKEQMVMFKNRVLDLVEAFSKAQPGSVLNLQFLKPIVNLINLTNEKSLGVKAHQILKTRIAKVKIYKPEQVITEDIKIQLFELLQWLQLQAGRYSSNSAHMAACSQSSILVAKALCALDLEYIEKVIGIYSQTLQQWAVNPKNRITTTLFFDFINWLGTKRKI